MYISSFRRLPCVLLFGLAGGGAVAACPPIAQYRYVGTGAGCTYSTIQEAIDAGTLCPGTTVVVSNTQAGNPVLYANQAITIQDKSLTIAGSRDACGSPPPVYDPDAGHAVTPPPQIKIVGNGANPVFKIRGNSQVTFAHLDISGGKGSPYVNEPGGGISYVGYAAQGSLQLRNVTLHHNTSQHGGGIGFYGAGALRLDGAWIHHNSASGYGGGVQVMATTGHVEFQIANNAVQQTTFEANQAMAGGGVFLSGDLHLDAASLALGFLGNAASGSGGALHVAGGVKADIAGTTMDGNHADSGGAIAVDGDAATRLRLYGMDAAYVTRLMHNTADQYGGGLYAGGHVSGESALVCVFDTQFGNNSADATGSAFAIASARLKVNPADTDAECDYAELVRRGARHCAPGYAPCNRIHGNVAQGTTPDFDDDGAVIAVMGGTLQARRVRVDANTGGRAVHVFGAQGSVELSNCLVYHNTFTHELLYADGAAANIESCTFADDVVVGANVFAGSGALAITRSIVAEAKPVFPAGSATATAQYAMFNPPALPGTDSTVVYGGAIEFADAANGDYHLRDGTGNPVDFAPADPSSNGIDLDRQPRVVDMPVGNFWGTQDLGPYEYQVGGVRDRIFYDAFEP